MRGKRSDGRRKCRENEDLQTDSIKSCCKVKEKEDSDESRVSCKQNNHLWFLLELFLYYEMNDHQIETVHTIYF